MTADNKQLAISNAALLTQRHALYKESGVEWLGQVPENWSIKRLKDIGTSIIGIVYSPDDIVDNNSQGVLVLRSSNIQKGKLSLLDVVYVNQKIRPRQTVRMGDILICSRNGSRDLIGKNICIDESIKGCTFGAFMTIYRSRHFKFISNFFNSQIFKAQSGLFMSSTINQLTINTLNNFLIPLPPLPEQAAIANYLDQKTAQIDHEIDLLSKKTALYANLKQSLINETVTRGLDKNVALKDSGVEWLGQVPEHWSIKRLKDNSSLFHGYSFSETDFAPNVSDNFLIKITELQNNKVCIKPNTITLRNQGFLSKYKIIKNDILIALSGATAGKVAIFDLEKDCYLNQRVAKVLHNKKYEKKFIFYFLNQKTVVDEMYLLSNITAQPNFNNNILFINIPTPPFHEQKAIADYLDQKTAQIDNMVSAIDRKIATLQELRKTLINDVVTGQIKVI